MSDGFPPEAYDGIPSTDEQPPLAFVDATELLERPYAPPAFMVDYVVPRRSVGLWSGDTGSGKTNLALNIALSVAAGAEFALGRFAIARDDRPVLFNNGEMDEATLTRFLHSNAVGLGVALPPGRLLFQGETGFADFFLGRNDAEAAPRFEALLEQVRPCWVIFDTLRELFELDENDASEARRVFKWFRHLAQRFDLAVTVTHHWRKLSLASNNTRERVAGSRDLVAAADLHLALKA